jgi:endonuclease-3
MVQGEDSIKLRIGQGIWRWVVYILPCESGLKRSAEPHPTGNVSLLIGVVNVNYCAAMPRESIQAKKGRALLIMKRLAETYPDAHCELDFTSPFQLLIATILSAQSTDKQVNIVTKDLFQKYKSPQDFASADLTDLENDLRRIGLFRSKARNIQKCCVALVEKHGGEVPKTMEELTALGGVGRKTANVVLGNAFNINEGIVVDTHVARLSHRLGLSSHDDPVKIEQDLQKLIPRDEWCRFSHLLIWHGRRRCFARNPDCEHCEVAEYCPCRFIAKTES